MLQKDIIYFEDLDMLSQNVFIDLFVSIIENKRKQKLEQEEHSHEESSDIFEVQ